MCLGELRNKPGLTFDDTGCEKIGMLISSQNWVVYINPTKLQTIRGPFLFAFLKWNKWNSTLTALAPDIALAIPALFFPLLVSIGMDHPANSVVFIKALCCKQLGPLRDSAYTWHSKMKEGIFMKVSIGFSRKEAKNFQQRGDTIFSHFWKSAKGWKRFKKKNTSWTKKSGQMASDGNGQTAIMNRHVGHLGWRLGEWNNPRNGNLHHHNHGFIALFPAGQTQKDVLLPAHLGTLKKLQIELCLALKTQAPTNIHGFHWVCFFFTPEVTVPGFKGPRCVFFFGKKKNRDFWSPPKLLNSMVPPGASKAPEVTATALRRASPRDSLCRSWCVLRGTES